MLPERATGPISTSHYGWDTLRIIDWVYSVNILSRTYNPFICAS
jgi:hypothetical protein